ncbi:MAG: DUF1730 domain-containing protein [Ruminococcaceae bacterium]|nr:DUF1730 domain-containing protein [Oscillospiraceae bacterium]
MSSVQEQLRSVFSSLGMEEVGFLDYTADLAVMQNSSLRRLPPEPAGIILVLFPYRLAEYPGRNISRYAVVPDYHKTVPALLNRAAEELGKHFPGEAFVSFTDHSPIDEVSCAARAGLGMMGENRLLISPRYGSFVFIGELITTLPLNAPPQPIQGCGSCGKCREACPTGTLREGFCAENCLSHITQKKGDLTPGEILLIQRGGSAWGCDVCQEVCPHNIRAALPEEWPITEDPVFSVSEDALDLLCKERAFGFRGPGVLRRNLALLSPSEI